MFVKCTSMQNMLFLCFCYQVVLQIAVSTVESAEVLHLMTVMGHGTMTSVAIHSMIHAAFKVLIYRLIWTFPLLQQLLRQVKHLNQQSHLQRNPQAKAQLRKQL